MDEEWEAWYEGAVAASVADAITSNGLLSAASIAFGAAQVLSDGAGVLSESDRQRLVAIVREHTGHLFETLRNLAEPPADATIDLGLEPAS